MNKKARPLPLGGDGEKQGAPWENEQMGVGGGQWTPDRGRCDLPVQRRIKKGTDERIVVSLKIKGQAFLCILDKHDFLSTCDTVDSE